MDWLWNYLVWVVLPIAGMLALACVLAPVLGDSCDAVASREHR